MPQQTIEFLLGSDAPRNTSVELRLRENDGGYSDEATATSTSQAKDNDPNTHLVLFDVAPADYKLSSLSSGMLLAYYYTTLGSEDRTYEVSDYPPTAGFSQVLANQNTMLNRLQGSFSVTTNPTDSGLIKVRRGDAYDDIAWATVSIEFNKDVNGRPFKFVVKRKADPKESPPILEATGTGTGTACMPILTSELTSALLVSKFDDDFRWECQVQLGDDGTSHQTLDGLFVVEKDRI